MTSFLIRLLIVASACVGTLKAQEMFPTNAGTGTRTYVYEPGSEPREHNIDVQHMLLRVQFNCAQGKVNGIVTHYFTPLRESVDSIYFDAIGIQVSAVLLNGKPVEFKSMDTGLIVRPTKPLKWGLKDSITITYSATPRRGIYFIGWNDQTQRKRKQVWTQGQGTDNRYWIPMYDEMNDKYTTETIVTFESGYEVLSNGIKVSQKSNPDKTTVWHYKMTKPHAPYLLMLGIGKYDIYKAKAASGVPMNMYYYPEWKDRVDATYRHSVDAMNFMEQELGYPYPWESYSQIPVMDYIYGAMENTTATVFGDFYHTDERGYLDRNYVNTNVHELVHQWFGDLVTARSGKHNWLQESFATFYPKLFFRKFYGEDRYQFMRRSEHESALSAGSRDNTPIVNTRAGSARYYPKGSSVLDMLRYVVGEEQFRAAVRDYLKRHAYSNVVTSDFYHAFQDALGLTLDWFFEQWLYRGGEPHYDVKWNATANATTVAVKQIHKTDSLVGLFTMPIVIEVHSVNGKYDKVTAVINKAEQTITIPNSTGAAVAYVLFDPGSNVLKKLTFNKEQNEVLAQSLNAKNALDRLDALVQVRKLNMSETDVIKHLATIYSKDPNERMRAEAIDQLALYNSPEAITVLRKSFTDPHQDVRGAALKVLKKMPGELEQDARQLLKDSAYDVVVESLTLLSNSYPDNTAEYIRLSGTVAGMHSKVRLRQLELTALKDSKAMDELIGFTGSGHEFVTRQRAMEILQRLDYCDERALDNIIEAKLSTNNRLAGTATGVIRYFQKKDKCSEVINRKLAPSNWQPWQNNILKQLSN